MIPLHASAPVEALKITDPFPAGKVKPLTFWLDALEMAARGPSFVGPTPAQIVDWRGER